MIARRLIPLKEPSKLLRRVKNAHRAEAQGKNWKLLEHDWSQAGRRPITNRGDLERVTAAALRKGQGPVGEEFYATFLTQEMTKTHHNARSPVPSVPSTPCKKTIRKYMRIAADTQKPTVVSMLLKAIRQVCVVAISNFSKRYESVVLADATKLWWWSGNGHFCVAMVYNLPLLAMPSTKRKSESANLWKKRQMQYALLEGLTPSTMAHLTSHPEGTASVSCILVMEQGIIQQTVMKNLGK